MHAGEKKNVLYWVDFTEAGQVDAHELVGIIVGIVDLIF